MGFVISILHVTSETCASNKDVIQYLIFISLETFKTYCIDFMLWWINTVSPISFRHTSFSVLLCLFSSHLSNNHNFFNSTWAAQHPTKFICHEISYPKVHRWCEIPSRSPYPSLIPHTLLDPSLSPDVSRSLSPLCPLTLLLFFISPHIQVDC